MAIFQQRSGRLNDKTELSGIKNDLGHYSKERIWAIGGGKGGVGKSLITANLSISLAFMGFRVVTIDLDLGGANLHSCLGVPIPEVTLSDYLTKKIHDIKELVVETNIPNLSIISGAQDELGMANLKSMHKNKILSHLDQLNSHFVLFDLGAGTTLNTLDFFLSSEKGILVVLPEPTSIENTYRFLKSVYYRKLQLIEELFDLGPLIKKAMNAKLSTPDATPSDLIKRVIDINPEKGLKLKKELGRLKPQLIMNQVRTQADIDLGFSIQTISKRYFGIDIDYVGFLEYDSSVWQSVKRRKPLLTEFPNSKLVSNFDKIIHRLLN